MTEIASITSDSNLTLGNNADSATVNRGIILHDVDGSDNNTATVSFDDFLDMINPLEHIPVLSSVYRGITGETINPIARVAGDALYGGVFGLASAGLSALGALGDEVYASNNDGKSASSTLVAALFGSDDEKNGDQTTQLADNTPPANAIQAPAQATASIQAAAPTQTAATTVPSFQLASQAGLLQTPAKQSSPLQMPTSPLMTDPNNALSVAQSIMPTNAATMMAQQRMATAFAAPEGAATSPAEKRTAAAAAAAMATSDPGKGMPIDRAKAPYGGAMDTSMMQSAMQNQALALAMANGKNNMQSAQAIRSSRFAIGGAASATTALPTANAATTASTDANETTASSSPTATTSQPVPQALIDDMRALKGLDKYRNAAQSLPVAGSSVNVTN